MTTHLGSEHIWQLDVDGYTFNCVVSEAAGHYHCYKVKGTSKHYNQLAPTMRSVYRDRAKSRAEQLCKLKANGLYTYEQNS